MIDTVSFISASLSLNGDTSRADDSTSSWTETVWRVVDAFVDDVSVVVLKSSETSFGFIVSEEFEVSHIMGDFLKALWILNFRMFRCKNSWRWGILDSYNFIAYNFIKLAFCYTFHFRIERIWRKTVWNDSNSVKTLQIPNTFCKILLKVYIEILRIWRVTSKISIRTWMVHLANIKFELLSKFKLWTVVSRMDYDAMYKINYDRQVFKI